MTSKASAAPAFKSPAASSQAASSSKREHQLLLVIASHGHLHAASCRRHRFLAPTRQSQAPGLHHSDRGPLRGGRNRALGFPELLQQLQGFFGAAEIAQNLR